MKSAYEMALARMGLKENNAPHSLTEAQRAELSSIDRRYAAKIAEREIVLRGEMAKAREAGDNAECDRLRELLQRERAEIEENRELSKELVRKG